MACLGDCLDLSPPPDGILFMPPPPAPLFMFPDLVINSNSTNCVTTQTCEAAVEFLNNKGSFRNMDRIEYNDMPRKETEAKWNVSGIGDTWLLALVASTIGVLILGALLAMFLLKCREMHLINSSEHCSLHTRDLRPIKNIESRDCNSLSNGNSKLIHPVNASFYTPTPSLQDNRMVWAAITPRGTEHFVSENYSRNLMAYEPPENHYESIEPRPHNIENNVAFYGGYHKGIFKPSNGKQLILNAFLSEYDYDDPTPLIESYQMNDIEYVGDHQYQTIGNTDMRCASLRFNQYPIKPQYPTIMKPKVSQPTRIEHPNLPPLNLNPNQRSANNTLKKNNTGYRTMDPGRHSKYGL
ncbi:uncharacterized protein LOC126735999 isoform X2 [Anthonomus grandis grandis]|nr:uncharacterized protein LOC126735999 isoform X2 [Anthonomus grandis grandis]